MGDFTKYRAYAVPIAALVVCCAALVGVAYSYNGLYNDPVSEGDVDSHYIKVDQKNESLEYSDSRVAFDLNRDVATNGTISYTFSSNQRHTEVVSVSSASVTVLNKLGTVTIICGEDPSKAVTVTGTATVADPAVYPYVGSTEIRFVAAGGLASSASASHVMTATSAGVDVDVYAAIVYNASAISDSNVNSLKLPAFTVTVNADAGDS